MTDVDPDDVSPPERGWAASALLFLVFGFSAAALLWAGTAEIDEVTRAPGRVVPSKQVQVIQNLEGGIVREILVARGQRVAAGQVLLRLDPTRFDADFQRGREDHNALSAQFARLTAESRGEVPEFDAALRAEAPDLVAGEMEQYRTRSAALEARMRTLRSQLDQRRKAIEEARARRAYAADALELAEQELGIVEPLVAKGLDSRIELIRAGQRVSTARGERKAAALALEQSFTAVQETEHEINASLQQFRSETVRELAEVRRRLNALVEAMPALADRLSRTEVRSPVDGIVNQLLVTTIGAVAQPGATMVEIVPVDDTLLVEARISPNEIAFLAPGQASRVKITAYDYTTYGTLDGRIEHIGADAIETKDGEQVYLAQVRTESARLPNPDGDGQSLSIIPGMVAEVDILTGKRTVLDYVLTPLEKLGRTAFREN